jgi:large subunit ribosomal protein L32
MRKSGMNRPMIQPCKNCSAPRIPHRVCMSCGQYNGEVVVVKQAAEE